jgi:Xaa-Pro aminopeptidase
LEYSNFQSLAAPEERKVNRNIEKDARNRDRLLMEREGLETDLKNAELNYQEIVKSQADIKNETPDNRAFRKYLYHGISHHLGIDVHDLGTKTEPIKAGMVFTVEPGIYIEEEQFGVRIENNVWITKTGNVDLMKNIPRKAEEIEKLMK